MFRDAVTVDETAPVPAGDEARRPCPVPETLAIERLPILRPEAQRLSRGRWIQFADPNPVEWNRYVIAVPGLPDGLRGLRIAHLTDLHMTRHWTSGLDLMLKLIAQHRPDLIVVTGDLVNDRRDPLPAVPLLRRFFDGLTAPLGVWAIPGNHDGRRVLPALEGTNIQLMDGRRRVLEHRGAALELIGLPGPYRANLTQGFLDQVPAKTEGLPRVVLSHYPDHLLRAHALRPDVFMAGHTHGGQCCLPGRVPLLRHDHLPRRLCAGLHRIGDGRAFGPTWLSVPRGLGFSGPAVRAFCPTEIIELELAE